MASLAVEGPDLVVRLSPLERAGALVAHDPRAPLAAVRSVRVTHRPYKELRGLRAPGAAWPGAIALGTWRHRGGRDFAAVRGGRAAVVVDLAGADYERFVVTERRPHTTAAELERHVT
jgi:hypothetical protein